MGQGPSISQMAEKEQKFRDYLTQIRADLEKDKQTDIANLNAIIDKYYKDGGWTFDPLMQLDSVEVQQVSSWSLDNVTKMINSVRDAIFSDTPPPSGVTVEKPADFTASMEYLNNLTLLVASKAFSAIQGILQTFATQSSFHGKSITKVEVIAPGMTLFISIRSDIWKSQGFFNNDSIAQYLYIIRSNFSLQQAGDMSKYNDLLAYEDLKAAYRTRIEDISKVIADPKTEFSALDQLDQQLGYLTAKLADIQALIDDLQKKKLDEAHRRAQNAIMLRKKALVAQPA